MRRDAVRYYTVIWPLNSFLKLKFVGDRGIDLNRRCCLSQFDVARYLIEVYLSIYLVHPNGRLFILYVHVLSELKDVSS